MRYLAIFAGMALFVSDYGLDVWAKPVPPHAYGLVLAVALGVDAKNLRDVILKFLNAWAGGKND